MKYGEIAPISTKLTSFGRNQAKGGDTLPRTLLNIILLQPPEKSTRACDSTVLMFFTCKSELQVKTRNLQFDGEIAIFHPFTSKVPKKHKFGQAIPCSNQCLAPGVQKDARITKNHPFEWNWSHFWWNINNSISNGTFCVEQLISAWNS